MKEGIRASLEYNFIKIIYVFIIVLVSYCWMVILIQFRLQVKKEIPILYLTVHLDRRNRGVRKRKEYEWLKITRLHRFVRGNGKETEGMRGIANPLYSFILFFFRYLEDWEGKKKIIMKKLSSFKFNPNLLTIY